MFALATPILFGAIAAALDYSRVSHARTTMADAADAAILAATKLASEEDAQGNRKWKKKAEEAAKQLFFANIQAAGLENVTFNPTIEKTGSVFSGTGNYQTNLNLSVARVIGFPKAEISDTVEASMSSGGFIDIAFLIDNSASMGIGATAADQQLMYDRMYDSSSKTSCAFACHLPKNDYEKQFTGDRARSLGAKLRIDIVRDGLLKAIETLEEKNLGQRLQISVHTFSNHVETLVAPSTDLTKIKDAVEKLDMVRLHDKSPKELGGTYIRGSLDTLRNYLKKKNGTGGSGNSTNSRKSYIVLFSDGIEDVSWNYYNRNFGDGTPAFAVDHTPLRGWKTEPGAYDGGKAQPFNPDSCGQIKKDNRTLYTAQVEYETAVGMRDLWWNPPKVDYINSKAKDITAAFKKCASEPDKHFVASNSSSIETVFNTIADDIAEKTRLSLRK